MAFISIWIIFAIVMGYWNKSRGNSFILAALLSLFLSPLVAGIIILVTKKNPRGIEKNSIVSGDMKKCPECAELIKTEAMKCRFCGHVFE